MKKDAYKYFWEAYTEKTTVYDTLFDIVPSNAAYEKFTSAIGMGDLLEKPESEDLSADTPMEGYTVICKNRTFGRLARFSKESVEDAQKTGNLIQQTVGSWGKSYLRTKEKFYAKFFNKGAMTAGDDIFDNTISGVVTDPSGKKIYDGKPFFSTSHADKVGNTYSNYSSSNSLTSANLQTVYTTFTSTNNRDERGNIIELTPDTLLIPPALNFTARVILETQAIPGSADNDINVLTNILNPKVWPYLDDSDGWFVGTAKEGLLATERQDPAIDTWQDETNLDFFVSINCRYGGCITNWRHWYANNISSS